MQTTNVQLDKEALRVHMARLLQPEIMEHKQQYNLDSESKSNARNKQTMRNNSVGKYRVFDNYRY